MLVVAGIVVVMTAVVALTVPENGARRTDPAQFETVAEPATSTTVPETATTAPEVKSTPTSAPSPSTTTVTPRPAAMPDRSRPAGATYTPQAVWPETVAELDRLQAAVDQGQQPWRNDPVAVARAYVLDRGLPTPGMGPFEASTADAGSVNYSVAGSGGRVDLQRMLNGTIWYVVGSRSATFPGLRVTRQTGSLALVLHGGADGTLTTRVKRPGGAWGAENNQQMFAGAIRSYKVATPETAGELILQLRLHGDGKAGLAELYLGAGTEGARYSALDSESRLRVDGLGPVRIGMDLEAAAAASGLAMRYQEGPYCRAFVTDGPPAGLFLTSIEGSVKLDFITVSEPSIATVSGIRVGSSLAEVRRTYGDRLRGSVQDGWGKLVFRPEDPSLNHVSLALLFSEGKVAGMWAGLRSVVEADEACA